MLTFWLSIYLLEVAMFTSPLWWFKQPLSPALVFLVTVSSGWLAFKLTPALAVCLVVLTAYRLFNIGRVIRSRMHYHYLLRATRRTSFVVLGLHIAVLWLYLLTALFTSRQLLVILVGIQLIGAGLVLMFTLKNIAKLRFKMPTTYLTDKELPTVTVAIPARNETTDLEECLRSVLASDYPKLEIIVLDDCSQAKTSQIIKSFAQEGVRFVQGEQPAERWLAKNQAYHKLFKEATGELILFMGVDVRLGARSIRAMVNLLKARKKTMLSVLPVRQDSTPASAIVQPMRYWWELALPRRAFNRPPVLSTCWLIDRKTLKKLGGFASVSHTIIPEGVFARELIKTDSYSFVRSSGDLVVKTVKSLAEQYETTVRVRYPQIRRRPEWALVLTLLETVFLLLPFVVVALAIAQGEFSVAVSSAITIALLVLTHVVVMFVSDPANVLWAVFNYPIVVVTELFLSYLSMIKYEFFKVVWKERNICIPVMHTIPSAEFKKLTDKL